MALLCCLLATAVAAEVLRTEPADPLTQPAGRGTHTADQAPEHPFPTPPGLARDKAIILGRPLFAPDRRPAEVRLGTDAGLPRLTGLVAMATDAVAIFQPLGTSRPLALRQGETVNGWDVTAITSDSVSLRKSTATLVLRPEFGDLHAGVATIDQKPPPSRWQAAAATGVLRARWSNPQLQP
jgi:hypothetical protein